MNFFKFGQLLSGLALVPAALWAVTVSIPGGSGVFSLSGTSAYYTGGNVGIGTSSPSDELHVYGSSNGDDIGVLVENDSTGSSAFTHIYVRNNNSSLDAAGLLRVGSNNTNYGGANSLNLFAGSGSTTFGFVTNNSLNARVSAGGGWYFGSSATDAISKVHVADGHYLQAEDNNAGAPTAADCDNDAEYGRFSIDTANERLYICNGAARGWDYVALTD